MDRPLEDVRPLIRTRQHRHFTGAPVGREHLHALLEVARWSGSSRNSQPWRFIATDDQALIQAVAEAGLPQTRGLRTAPSAIAISMPSEESRAAGYAYDEGRVAERLLIGASLLGLGAGISWLRPDIRDWAAQLLGVPDDRFVRTVVAIGHPTDEARAPKSAPGEARLPLDELVSRRPR